MTRRYQLKKRLLAAERDALLYVLDIDPGRVHRFNDSARIVFQLCLEPRAEAEIIEAYARAFGLDPATAAEDARAALAQMEALGLFRGDGDA